MKSLRTTGFMKHSNDMREHLRIECRPVRWLGVIGHHGVFLIILTLNFIGGHRVVGQIPVCTDLNAERTRVVSDQEPVDAARLLSTATSKPRAVWIDREDVMRLPLTGRGWSRVKHAAKPPLGPPSLYDQNSNHDVATLAKALVSVRLERKEYADEVRRVIRALMEQEDHREPLAVARNLPSYVIAADLVGLDPNDTEHFREWLRRVMKYGFEGRTLVRIHESRPNNWGAMAGAARMVVAAYLGDDLELAKAAKVFQAYLGDRSVVCEFRFAANRSWQSDPTVPYAINPVGAIKAGISIDGAQPEEMRRAGDFQWPPPQNEYPWEGLQGLVVQAEVLHRQGYESWKWSDAALARAARFLYHAGLPPDGDDRWVVWLLNARCQVSFAADSSASFGKNMGWTAWTHAAIAVSPN